MAEKVPPPNATNAAIVLAEGDLIAGNTIANLKGNRSRGLGPKPAKVKKINAKLDLEQQKTRSPFERFNGLGDQACQVGQAF
jgi:hypothetical protein